MSAVAVMQAHAQSGLIPYAPINERQSRYVRRSMDSWLNVMEGGKRSSKNVVNLMAWATSIETHPDRLHLAGGFSQSTARVNIIDSNGFGLRWIFDGRCRPGKFENVSALYVDTPMGEKVILISGGGKVNDVARIKGFSVGTVYVTEANECHPDYIKETFDRTLHSSRRQMFMDLNPKPPRHVFYKDVLDFHMRQQQLYPDYGLNYLHTTIADNMALSDRQLRDILRTYDPNSLWFKRDIMGLRIAGEGMIYEHFDHDRHVWNKRQLEAYLKTNPISFLTIGVDFGGSGSASVFTLVAFTRNFRKCIVLDEYFDSNNFSSDHLQSAWIKKANLWKDKYPRLTTADMDHEILLVKSFRAATPRVGVRLARKGPISGRISATDMMMATDKLVIMDNCRNLIDAFESAVWDNSRPDDLVRLDDGTVNIDSLDAFEYATERHYRDLLRF